MNEAERRRIWADEQERLKARRQADAEWLAQPGGCSRLLWWSFLFALGVVVLGLLSFWLL